MVHASWLLAAGAVAFAAGYAVGWRTTLAAWERATEKLEAALKRHERAAQVENAEYGAREADVARAERLEVRDGE